jgi:hypothetical protein
MACGKLHKPGEIKSKSTSKKKAEGQKRLLSVGGIKARKKFKSFQEGFRKATSSFGIGK